MLFCVQAFSSRSLIPGGIVSRQRPILWFLEVIERYCVKNENTDKPWIHLVQFRMIILKTSLLSWYNQIWSSDQIFILQKWVLFQFFPAEKLGSVINNDRFGYHHKSSQFRALYKYVLIRFTEDRKISLLKSLNTADVCINTHLRAFSHNKKKKIPLKFRSWFHKQ